ncbi:ferritin subunit [Culex quinquefasciatus]|uniref:Ferritin subunit n=1 Tax=Culex quinquefasciatus TaxID=7176 RepID=B0X918_CULQU|nr:ferritin subunit [Culex quinquefasciatus]|eukprot:XP_001866140.1 ferritin subunit [Culex quinquefasciatus]
MRPFRENPPLSKILCTALHNLSVAVARATTGVALPNLPLQLCLLLRFLAMAQQTGVELKREYVWDGLHRSCVDALHGQIKKEFDASIEKINLPGFEKFFHAAGEEREHGIKLIEYALMRGKESVNKNIFQLDYSYKARPPPPDSFVCEGGKNDYHLVDYLTGEYVDEQHKGQRELAEKIATLRKMTDSDDAPKEGRKLAEFLFDKNHM